VHFAGERRDRVNLHRGFDISVLASLSEGFPNTLVEAMAAGNPVVATSVGGTVDAVVDGQTGILVPPGDPEELAGALLRLVQDKPLRLHFGMQGGRRAAELYNAASVVSSVERMYTQLLSGRDR
jgi:glycosyltransferase involved in cell wall biosynthesis